MLCAWCLISVCLCCRDSTCARGRRAAFSRDAGAKGGRWGPHFGQDFFCCPENRPWFPGTMQLMRVSPRKIRLWHHGFLKHTAEPTLSPAIIKPQWISTVDWNWERGRISSNGLDPFFFFNTCFNLTANIPVVARGSQYTCWTLVSLFPFTSGLGSR